MTTRRIKKYPCKNKKTDVLDGCVEMMGITMKYQINSKHLLFVVQGRWDSGQMRWGKGQMM